MRRIKRTDSPFVHRRARLPSADPRNIRNRLDSKRLRPEPEVGVTQRYTTRELAVNVNLTSVGATGQGLCVFIRIEFSDITG
jgi:hypothetical protein